MFLVCQDVLPALLHTLAPQLRPVAERLLQPDEHAALADVTDSMLAYGLRYDAPALAPVFGQQASAPATNLPLKPAVDRLCAYPVLSSEPSARAMALGSGQQVGAEVVVASVTGWLGIVAITSPPLHSAAGHAGSPAETMLLAGVTI